MTSDLLWDLAHLWKLEAEHRDEEDRDRMKKEADEMADRSIEMLIAS